MDLKQGSGAHSLYLRMGQLRRIRQRRYGVVVLSCAYHELEDTDKDATMSSLKKFRLDLASFTLPYVVFFQFAAGRWPPWRLATDRRPNEDKLTRLPNHRGLLLDGGAIVADCARRRKSATLVIVRFEDLPELLEIFGSALCHAVTARIARRLEKVARSAGMVARTGPTEFALLFPDCSEREAHRRIERTLGSPPRFEFSLEKAEIILVPELAADTVSTGETLDEVYDRLLDRLTAFTTSEHVRLDAMTKQRERYARS